MKKPKGPFALSCGMPMDKPEDFGLDADGFRRNGNFQYCLRDGCFTVSHITMQQMIGKVAGMAAKMNISEGMFSYLIAVLIVICPFIVNAEIKGGREMKIIVTSTAFQEGGMIPRQYTCDGKDMSPPISWSAIPEGTKSIAIIADDPDSPGGTWVHWVVYNLPPDLKGLPENVPSQKTLANGGILGQTDFRRIGYGGPCPPSGTHRYFFKVYALDAILDLDQGAIKKRLLNAMEGHILAEGELMGKYKR